MSERLVRSAKGRISEESERRITYAIALALVCLLPSIVLAVFLWREVGTRSDANHALIVEVKRHEAEQEAERAKVREAIRSADLANCRADEVVKARLRKLVAFNADELNFTLEQLNIDPLSSRGQALIDRARRSSAEATAALAPSDCTALPDPTNPQSSG